MRGEDAPGEFKYWLFMGVTGNTDPGGFSDFFAAYDDLELAQADAAVEIAFGRFDITKFWAHVVDIRRRVKVSYWSPITRQWAPGSTEGK